MSYEAIMAPEHYFHSLPSLIIPFHLLIPSLFLTTQRSNALQRLRDGGLLCPKGEAITGGTSICSDGGIDRAWRADSNTWFY